MNNRLINTKVAGGGGGCTDIVDNYDPFGGNGVALYQLNGNALDSSPNGYNGTPYLITYSTGVFGQAATYSGGSGLTSSIYIPNTVYTTSTSIFSASIWIKLNDALGEPIFIGNGGTVGGTTGWALYGDFNTGVVGITFRDANQNQVFDSSGISINDGAWHNLVVTNNNGEYRVYLDAQEVISGTTTLFTNNQTPTYQTFLGNRFGRNEANSGINGQIDQVRIFNTALTPLEVEALYTEELCICDGTVDTLDILGDGSCIATYQLDGNANDLSGNYSGTPTDVSYGVGEFDLAGVFNGSSSYITTPLTYNSIVNLNDKTQDFSFALWMYQSSLPSAGTKNVFAINEYAPSYQYIGLVVNGLNINFVSYPGGAAGDVAVTTTDLNVWTHIACVRESSTMKIYKNGSLAQSTPMVYPNMSLDSTLRWVFGRRSDGGNDNYFNGSIDQVRIFNKALSAGEVTTLYNETACTKVTRTAGATQILGDSSCIAYYKLDGTANDETGTYNGTFTSPDYRNGEFDLAANFNGINGEIALSNAGTTNLNLDGDFSISIWVKPLGVNAQSIYQFIYGSGVKEFGITYDPVVQRGGAYFWTGSAVASVGGDIPLSNWSNIVFSRSKTTGMKFYINNSLVDSDSFTGNGATISSAYDALGQWGRPSIDRYFKGQLDNVRFFNKAVSSSEVTTLYNEGI